MPFFSLAPQFLSSLRLLVGVGWVLNSQPESERVYLHNQKQENSLLIECYPLLLLLGLVGAFRSFIALFGFFTNLYLNELKMKKQHFLQSLPHPPAPPSPISVEEAKDRYCISLCQSSAGTGTGNVGTQHTFTFTSSGMAKLIDFNYAIDRSIDLIDLQ